MQGFATGINISSGAIGAALEHATVSRCQVGLRVTDKLVSARNITTVDVKQPVLVSGADASLILLDSTLGASAQTAAALRSPDGAQLYLRNVTAAGPFAAVDDRDAQVASPVAEYSHSPPFSLFPGSPRHSTFANVPIRSTPITIREPPSSWRVVNVDLLAKATVTEALQAALDGARTVFLRRNDALVPRTRRTNPDEPREGGPLIKQVVLRKQLRRLHGGWIGLGSALGADTPAGFMNVVVDDADHSEPITIESIDVTGILHSSRNELIIRHVFAHHPAATCFATAQRPQLGDVFIESFQPKNTGGDTQPVGGPGLQIIASAPGSVRVWARGLDIEGTLKHVENRGGDLWVLGSKFGEIQGDPTVLAAGGRTELLGGLLNGGTPANTTMIFENESDASVIGFAFRFRDNGETFEERLEGQSKSVGHDAFPERQTWECIGQRHDGQPDCRWEVGNWLPFFRTHTESSDDRAGCFGALRHAGCLAAPRGCDVCAGRHQRVMKVAGCTDAQIEEWCGPHALKLDDGSLAAAGPRADSALSSLLANFWSEEQRYMRRCPANATDVDSDGDDRCSEPSSGILRAPSATCDHARDCCGGLPEPERKKCATQEGCHQRGCCWDDDHGPTNFCSPPTPPPAPALTGYWNYAEALHAVALGAATQPAKYGSWLRRMVDAQAAHGTGWRVDYFDDMNWAVLALLAAHEALPDDGYLDEARKVWGLVEVAWDDTACGGGLWWDRKHTQKATASNAGPALAAALLHAETGEPQFLAFATKAYGFWNRTMTDSSGAVTDHLDVHGAPPPIHHNCSHATDCCGELPKGSPAYKECTTPDGCQKRGCCWDENSPPHNWCSGKPSTPQPPPPAPASCGLVECNTDGDCTEAGCSRCVHAVFHPSTCGPPSAEVDVDAATCSKHEELFTYNEGLMLGAATALANATASPAYAADAARFAKHLVEKQTELKLGRVLVDSCDWGESPCHDCSQFKGIAYRELGRWLRSGLRPYSTLQDRVRTLLDDSAAAIWEGRQEGAAWDGPLFGTGWALGSRKSCPPSAASQGSAAIALLTHANL